MEIDSVIRGTFKESRIVLLHNREVVGENKMLKIMRNFDVALREREINW